MAFATAQTGRKSSEFRSPELVYSRGPFTIEAEDLGEG
jgi:hypothetical protein